MTLLIPNSTSCLANGVSMDEILVHSEHTGGLPPALKSTQQVRHTSQRTRESRAYLGLHHLHEGPSDQSFLSFLFGYFPSIQKLQIGQLVQNKASGREQSETAQEDWGDGLKGSCNLSDVQETILLSLQKFRPWVLLLPSSFTMNYHSLGKFKWFCFIHICN